jgi:hypothetical protein
MTVINPEDNTGSDSHAKEFREKWAIPFGRPGNAVDYAQCVFGLITVNTVLAAYACNGPVAETRTNMSREPNLSLTAAGSSSRVRGFSDQQTPR